VDRTRADDHKETVQRVGAFDDGGGIFSALQNGLFGFFGERNLMLKEVGRGEGVVATDCSISFFLTVAVIGTEYVLRWSSKISAFPRLGLSMKNYDEKKLVPSIQVVVNERVSTGAESIVCVCVCVCV
jgi:hypothetical protein